MKIIKLFFLVSIIFYGCKSESPTEIINEDNQLPKDSLLIGGQFTIIGIDTINNIALWDGETWKSLGTGISTKNVLVGCMAFYNGDLYVGGRIDLDNGLQEQKIAKWDGKKWTDVGGGINGAVRELVVYKNELYVAGWFSRAGGLKTDNIAKWDGITWSPVGEGFSDEVYTLCIYENELYVGGWFTKNSYGYVNANNIAKWNGVNWDTVGSGVNSGSWIMTLGVFNNELYATGNFSKCGNIAVSNIARWNNSIWRSVGNINLSNRTYVIANYKNELHIAGEEGSNIDDNLPYYVVWNGSNWKTKIFAFDGNGQVIALCSSDNYFYVGGSFINVNGKTVNGIFKWDGTSIHNFGSGVQGYVSSVLLK